MVIFIILAFLALIPTNILAAEESITLTTYYPSPYGVYSEMRLYPKDNPTTPCQEGLMYYDQSEHVMKVCGGIPSDWIPVGGSFWTLTAPDLYPNDPAWNVGIGTTTPGGKFHISGAQDESASGFGVTGVVQRLSATNNGVEAGWFAGVSGGINRATFGTVSAHNLGFIVGGGTRMTIVGQGASAGNVGIGKLDPQRKVEINGGGTTHGAAIRFSGQPANTDSAIIELMNPAGTGGAWSIGSKGNNNELFKIFANTAAADRFVINADTGTTLLNPSGGNTQMGFISSPPAPAKLSVNGNVTIGGILFVNNAPPANGLIVEGDVVIGDNSMQGSVPNGLAGNLEVNDIYLRSTGQWVSQSSGGGPGSWTCALRTAVQSFSCVAGCTATAFCQGNEKVITGGCFFSYTNAYFTSRDSPASGGQGWTCSVSGASGTLTAYANCCS